MRAAALWSAADVACMKNPLPAKGAVIAERVEDTGMLMGAKRVCRRDWKC